MDSTRQATTLGDTSWLKLLDEHMAASRRALRRYRGTEVKNLGDGLLASFDAPSDAIRCAQAIGNASRHLGLDVRAGVHMGACDVGSSDVRGIAVHITARVCGLARGGEVLVSEEVRELASVSGLAFTSRGGHELRGVPDSWELFAARI